MEVENGESSRPAISALAAENMRQSQTLFAPNKRQRVERPGGKSTQGEDDVPFPYLQNEYKYAETLPDVLAARVAGAAAAGAAGRGKSAGAKADAAGPKQKLLTAGDGKDDAGKGSASTQLVVRGQANGQSAKERGGTTAQTLSVARAGTVGPGPVRPEWHAPWKLMRVISGHLGWVRSLAVEPTRNAWFASGAGDRTIKIWDLASGSLRLTLTGHISTVRGLAISDRHPYLFSCGEDKMVKCWDLETNKVVRHYHGHLSGVYTLSLHPTLDVLVTGGRDGVARVWDMRTRANVHVLSGHTGTVADVKCQDADPQVISASLDSTIRMWDLAAGKTMGVLTHHKKGVRALVIHPTEFTFASGSTGSIKQWKCPEGAFMQNFEGHNAIINTLAVNSENVFFSGGDNGSMSFWDWKSGYRYQSLDSIAQPGSLDAEAGIMCSTFDRSGLRLICGEADKTIKVWKQDTEATPETHPIDWKPKLGTHRHY